MTSVGNKVKEESPVVAVQNEYYVDIYYAL